MSFLKISTYCSAQLYHVILFSRCRICQPTFSQILWASPCTCSPENLVMAADGIPKFLKKCFMAWFTSHLDFIGKIWVYSKSVINYWLQVNWRLLLLVFSANNVLMKTSEVTRLYLRMRSSIFNLFEIIVFPLDLWNNRVISGPYHHLIRGINHSLIHIKTNHQFVS